MIRLRTSRLHAPGPAATVFAAAFALALLAPLPALAVAGPAPAPARAPAKAPEVLVRLRSNIAVDGTKVTLGDLFQGAGPIAAAKVFAAAPAPGQTETFGIDSVMQAAAAAGLTWQPGQDLRVISVTRNARYVPVTEILAALKQALVPLTGQPNDLIQVAGRSPQLAIALDQTASVRVENLQYDPESHEFSALLAAPADTPEARRVPIQGRVVQAVEVPVPITRIDPGQIIRRADLRFVALPISRVDRTMVTDPAVLIGEQARHALAPSWPIRQSDVERPSLVKRGAMVRVSLVTPYMSLSTVGQALQSGGRGDLIPVMNLQSHKTIVGTIVGPDLVAVGSARVQSASIE